LAASAGFFALASVNGREVNTRVSRTDQGAYINYAIALRESNFTYTAPRNRMPLYPAFLALFLEPGDDQHAFFERGKKINTVLAWASLVLAAAVFLAHFPRHLALNMVFLAGSTVFLFKAPHVQAEILYYTVTFLAFVAVWRLFKNPSLVLAVVAGGLMALGHLTKASVLPGLVVVAVFFPLDALWRAWRGGQSFRETARRLIAVGVVIGVFFAVIFPYIAKSREIYGRYFYNVNSTFYMWCDSWDDAEARTKSAGDRRGWPDLPPDQIPSFSNYLKSHTPGEIAWRILNGISRVFNEMAKSYGYLGITLGLIATAVALIASRWRAAWRLLRRRPVPVLALAAYFVGYYLLVAWYSQIIQGNRFILGLFLPCLFTLAATITVFAGRRSMRLFQRRVPILHVVNAVFSVWLAIEIAVIAILRIPTQYGGS
jgi:hypothetical protein